MKKLLLIVMIAAIVATMSVSVIAANGPAPNSGDGVSDGSGLNSPFMKGEPAVDSPGPAPNSGDGESDGSGF